MRRPSRFAEKLCAPEGPVVGPDGWILNVCSFTRDESWPTRGGDITATHVSCPRHTHKVFSTSTADTVGIPAALAFGPDGCLYVTDEGRGAIVRVSPDGEQTDFISCYRRKPINGPNDLFFDPDGNLFFTDPFTSSLANPIGAVYGYEWERGVLHKIADGMAFPNGIVAREDRLYVAETCTNKIWGFDIVGPARAGNKREFCTLPDVAVEGMHGPDGMALDVDGNLYVATYRGDFVHVFDPAGRLADSIASGGTAPTNVCFGGEDFSALFVTLDDLGEIAAIPVGVQGQRLNFCPSQWLNHPWSKMLPLPPADSA
jgi:gluconolactonase